MKKLSFTNNIPVRLILAAGVSVLGIATLVFAQQHTGISKAGMTNVSASQTKPIPDLTSPKVTPSITLNGAQIPLDNNVSRDVIVPTGTAHVEVSGGHARVTTENNVKTGNTSNTSHSSINLDISSHNISNAGYGSSHTYESHNSSGGFTSSSTSISADSFGFNDVNSSR